MKQFLVSTLVVLAGAQALAAHELRGRVIGVTDGDTINVTDARNHLHKIRLEGIDAPEMEQPFGVDAKRHLKRLVLNRDVLVDVLKKDIYGREIGRVRLDGRDICLAQVTAGMAWHYVQYEEGETTVERLAYDEAQSAARTKHLGLWKARRSQAPWRFRELRKR